ncbi:MAG: WG repeat-containing protein [Oscillospiraceae bacterium]|nr:WG repeat-containing protein [Oscillospiraceae bacterium]
MKKVISFALVLALIFSLAACGKKNSDIEVVKDYESQPVSGDSEGGQNVALNPTEVRNFSNGYAWIESSGSKSCSLIDTSGKIICASTSWVSDSDEISGAHDMSNDACYVEENAGEKDGKVIYNYKIINKEGKVVASSEDGKFDEIYACGDNLFFVHKYESGIDVSRHLYGTINEKGEFVNQLRECPYGQLEKKKTKYIGGKAFLVNIDGSYYDHLYVYMSSNGKYFGEVTDKGIGNVGSSLYVINKNGIKAEGSDTLYSPQDGYEHIAIRSDGKIEKAPAFDAVVNGMLIKRDDDKTTFTDPTTGKTAAFSKYYPEYIIAAGNDNFLVAINGADGKVYYTVLDKKVNMLFEPVAGNQGNAVYQRSAGDGTNASDGRLVLDSSDGYSVLDYTGKVIIPAGTYSEIKPFNSGIAWAENSSDQYVGIDVNGKVVIS